MGRDKSTARKGTSKHSKNDQSRKKSSNIDKEEAGKVSGNERDISVDKTVDVTTKGMKDLDRSVVELDDSDSMKSEDIATESNRLDNKGLKEEKSLKVSTADENKELSEDHKKASKSGKKDSHKQTSKSKRSRSHSSDIEESRGDSHSTDRSSRKSRKREESDTEKGVVTRKSRTLEHISDVLAKKDNNNDDSL